MALPFDPFSRRLPMPSNLWTASVSPRPLYSAHAYEQMALQNEQLLLLQMIAEQNATADLVFRLSGSRPGPNFHAFEHLNESPSFSQFRLPPVQSSSFLSDPILRKDIIKPKVQRAFPSSSSAFYHQDTSCDSCSSSESSQSSNACFSDSSSKVTVRARCPNSPKNHKKKRVWTRIPANPACAVCATTSTPRWRLGANNARVCNACGLFYRKNQPSHGNKKLKLKTKPQPDLHKF